MYFTALSQLTAQQDTCLPETSLSLVLSGDVSLPELGPGRTALCVRTLLAELHKGLFLSQLLLPPPPLESTLSADGEKGQWVSSQGHIIPYIVHYFREKCAIWHADMVLLYGCCEVILRTIRRCIIHNHFCLSFSFRMWKGQVFPDWSSGAVSSAGAPEGQRGVWEY